MIQSQAAAGAGRRWSLSALLLATLVAAHPGTVCAGSAAAAAPVKSPAPAPALAAVDGARQAKTSRLARPLAQTSVTSAFGWRLDPVRRRWQLHKGVDYAAARGTRVYAAQDGTIEIIGRRHGEGLYIRIRHGNGIETGYAHLSRFMPGLHRGSTVRCGDTIGAAGATGDATGPHLHFEVMDHGQPADPQRFNTGPSTQVARLD